MPINNWADCGQRTRAIIGGYSGNDGRARHCRVAHDDSSLGDSLCAGVREAMEPLRTAGEYFLACGRNHINIRGKFSYFYRAVDKHGKTVDFLLRPDRGIAAAQAFFRKALSTSLPRWPRKITLDGHLQSHVALRPLRREDPKWKYVEVRSNQYLNNIVEQDHRAIKRRCAAMVKGFKSFASAAITLAGIELAHRIRKRQFSFGRGRYQNFGSLKKIWDRALA